MEAWTDFVIARYNYWIVIVLMMIGLYTVFARGNLVKKIVGLNIFQTSVFIFYITMGKIAGGTAPIYIGDELYSAGGHGDGYGDSHGDDAGYEGAGDHSAADQGADTHSVEEGASLHGKIDNDLGVNELKSAASSAQGQGESAGGSLHSAPDNAVKIANDALAETGKEAASGFDIAKSAAETAGEAAAYHSEVIYTNPLPHVLILTAIVVGVAGTAVGLALAVRIREAYGTIEEDELEVMDNVAEFGDSARDRADVFGGKGAPS